MWALESPETWATWTFLFVVTSLQDFQRSISGWTNVYITLFFKFTFMCTGFATMYVCALHVYLVPTEGTRSPRTGVTGRCEAWEGWESIPEPLKRAASTLHQRAISPAPLYFSQLKPWSSLHSSSASYQLNSLLLSSPLSPALAKHRCVRTSLFTASVTRLLRPKGGSPRVHPLVNWMNKMSLGAREYQYSRWLCWGDYGLMQVLAAMIMLLISLGLSFPVYKMTRLDYITTPSQQSESVSRRVALTSQSHNPKSCAHGTLGPCCLVENTHLRLILPSLYTRGKDPHISQFTLLGPLCISQDLSQKDNTRHEVCLLGNTRQTRTSGSST